MNINLIIGYLEKNEGLVVPENVQFASLDIYNQTADLVGWIDRPTNQKIIETWELIKDNIGLLQVKESLKSYYSNQSFELRNSICADYKLINAGLGVYDETINNKYKQLVIDFRNEFYRLSNLIDAATSKAELQSISPNFPQGV
jgi:hypothetical protein